VRYLTFTLLALGVFVFGCSTGSQTHTTTEQWDSLPRLERIAREYAKEHSVVFDFTNTHAESVTWNANLAEIDFYHGFNQPEFGVKIDRSGTVVDSWLATLLDGSLISH
jgi:hypothetical protein